VATVQHGLSGFLIRVANEPHLLDEYAEDRSALMAREGVAPLDRDAIMTGNLRQIRARLRREHPDVDDFKVIMEPEPPAPKPEPPEPKPEPEPNPR
jgi:hypothetical protein